jgi:hypothetical protein
MSASVRMTIELNIVHCRKLLESEADISKRRMISHPDFDDGAPIFANLIGHTVADTTTDHRNS